MVGSGGGRGGRREVVNDCHFFIFTFTEPSIHLQQNCMHVGLPNTQTKLHFQ